ncbi:MAG: zincin-like metallopeptidase domain-containing protein, partial [Pseudomonadota bacterium]
APKADPATAISDEIIAILERGTLPWRQPWVGGGSPLPLRACGEPYRGINAFLLSLRAMMQGYTSPTWMTFKQAKELGGHVRKGERSSLVVYYGTGGSKADASESVSEGQNADDQSDAAGEYRFLRSYRVFSANQIEGLHAAFYPEPEVLTGARSIPELDAWFARIGVTTKIGGTRACYIPALDEIHMPDVARFEDPDLVYAVLAHEHIHATRGPGRLERDFGSTGFGSEGYAKEELCAEIGAELLCRQLQIAPGHIEDTAAYIEAWIAAMRNDRRFIFKAAAHAQRAVDFILEAAGPVPSADLPRELADAA